MKILIAGDFCPKLRVADLLDRGEFDKVLGDVKPIIEQTDYSIVNFECPVCQGDEKPIEKLGPNLKCSEKGIEAVNWAGFNCVTLANNHFFDFGKEGVAHTIEACRKYDIDTVGGGFNLEEASHMIYKEIGDKTLAVINCCEHEFSIATETTAGSNPLNPITQYYAIREAKNKADYVLVIVHGGKEHIQVPSKRMIDTYRYFIDVGADAVVNHHQHCYCGMETYNGKPIYYGLGNFCFDWEGKRNCMWNEGYLVVLDTKDSVKSKVIPYTQCNDTVSVNLMQGDKLKDFEIKFESLCRIIQDENGVESANNEYAEEHALTYKLIFEPYQGWLSKHLYIRKLLPSRIHKSNSLTRINFIECESHKDMLIRVLKKLK